MKNLFRSIMLVAAAVTTFASCNKDITTENSATPEIPAGKGFQLIISAGNQVAETPDVRTEYDPAIQNIRWSGGEEMQLYVNQIAYKVKANVQSDMVKAVFPANIASITTPGTITLQGAIPSTSVIEVVKKDDAAKTVSIVRMQLISEQNGGTATNFDPAADILVAQQLPVELTQEDIDKGTKSVDNFRFGRPMAISKFTFPVSNSAISNDEIVESVKLTITSGTQNTKKHLTGRFYFDLTNARVVDKDGAPIRGGAPFYSGEAREYVQTTYAVQPTLGELAFWPITAPETLEAGDAMVFTIETNKNTIVKTVTLAEKLPFSNTQITAREIKLSTNNCVVTPKTVVEGDTGSLTMAEVQAFYTSNGTGYKTVSITNEFGDWTGKASATKNSTNYYLQINTDNTGNALDSHIKTPVFDGEILSLKLQVMPTIASHVAYLNTSVSTSQAVMTISPTIGSAEISFDLTTLPQTYSELYITGNLQIKGMEVTYKKDLSPKVVVADADKNFALAYSDEAEHSFNYTVRNVQLSDVTIAQDKASEDWLILDTATPGTVKFMAAANTKHVENTATITLSVANGNSVEVIVKQAAAPVQLAAPTGLSVTADGAKVSASWTAVANASNYAWRIATGGADVKSGTAATASVDVTGLSASTTYTFYVKAVGDGTTYLTSSEVSGSVTTAAIPALVMSTVTIDDAATTATSLTAQWTAVTNATGYKYKVATAGGTEVTAETAVSGTSVAVTGLDPETEYTISVKAVGNGADFVDSAYASVNGTTAAGSAASWHAESWASLTQSTSSYGAGTIAGTLGSWSYTGCSGFDMTKFTTKKGLSMGQSSDKSSITSPKFANGISGIKFNYFVNNAARSIVVTIYENGAVVNTQTITPTAANQLLSAEVTVSTTGETYFTFTPGSTSRRASVGDIEVMY